MKNIQVVVVLSLFFAIIGTANAFQLDVKVSNPGDRFTIGIPTTWKEKIYLAETGTSYAYWDGVGNAITITVKKTNSFKELLKMISNNQVNKSQLLELEKYFQQEAPEKLYLSLSLETIASHRAMVQTYTLSHDSLERHVLIKTRSYDFIKGDKQYQVSFSPPPQKNKELADYMFDYTYEMFFHDLLATLMIK